MQKIFDVTKPENYQDKDGRNQTAWTNIGTAFLNDGGSIKVRMKPGIAAFGDIVLFEREEKEEGQAEA